MLGSSAPEAAMIASTSAPSGDARRPPRLLAAAAASLLLYAALAATGDPRSRPWLAAACYLSLWLIALGAFRKLRGRAEGAIPRVLAAALAFRLVACLGAPALSDDVYRYVWDGRLALRGVHPYRHAPADAELAPYRDEVWERINHPQVPTIYPPLAQMLFAVLAATGAGARGFALGMGLLDMGAVLLLDRLLRALELPRERLLLYAWNPLAVLETAGSGHVEPLGVGLVLAFLLALVGERRARAALWLGLSVQAKLLPAILVPGAVRRMRAPELAVLAAAAAAVAAPYALTGPAFGRGLEVYLSRWEGNSVVFEPLRAALERLEAAPALKAAIGRLQAEHPGLPLPWEFLYRHVWPGDLARGIVFALALAWAAALSLRRGLDPVREAFLALGGLLLLAPTFKPWYALWVLPFAAAYASRGWLLLAALLPVSYLAGDGPVPWPVRLVEFGPPLALMGWEAASSRRRGERV